MSMVADLKPGETWLVIEAWDNIPGNTCEPVDPRGSGEWRMALQWYIMGMVILWGG